MAGGIDHATVVAAASDALGECEVVRDLSWADLGLSVVLCVRAGAQRYVAKGFTEERRYTIERDAYREVVPALGDRAPALVAADDERQVLVTTFLDGVPFDHGFATVGEERALHRAAGALARRLHGARPEVPLPGWAAQRATNVEGWIARAPEGLLDPADVAFARARVAELAGMAPPAGVVTHGDWQPRNWMVHDGAVRAIDFERVGVQPWTHDIQRLWWREWDGRPDLADAFYEGYGRSPTDDERAALWARSAGGHIVQIVWATEHGDARFAADGVRAIRSMRGA